MEDKNKMKLQAEAWDKPLLPAFIISKRKLLDYGILRLILKHFRLDFGKTDVGDFGIETPMIQQPCKMTLIK